MLGDVRIFISECAHRRAPGRRLAAAGAAGCVCRPLSSIPALCPVVFRGWPGVIHPRTQCSNRPAFLPHFPFPFTLAPTLHESYYWWMWTPTVSGGFT